MKGTTSHLASRTCVMSSGLSCHGGPDSELPSQKVSGITNIQILGGSLAAQNRRASCLQRQSLHGSLARLHRVTKHSFPAQKIMMIVGESATNVKVVQL
jgi:hypothetical protein